MRGLGGVDGEWITEKEYLSEEQVHSGRKLSEEDQNITRMEHLETVMASYFAIIVGVNLTYNSAVRPWRRVLLGIYQYELFATPILFFC